MVATRIQIYGTKQEQVSQTKHPLTGTFGFGFSNDTISENWNYATSTVYSAVNQTNAALAEVVSLMYYSAPGAPPSLNNLLPSSTSATATTEVQEPSNLIGIRENNSILDKMAKKTKHRKYPEMRWMLKNPYTSIRGRHDSPQSLDAVRSLLTIVHLEEPKQQPKLLMQESMELETVTDPAKGRRPFSQSTRSEKASQLAEGTIRALRDLALDEALDLHKGLRFWTSRWQHPVLSWLEAGPWVWFSPHGYSHERVGQRVSQIQAVLARRCAAIGELQQHLLRAGWQKGVAQWGVLGQGGQWVAVDGFDGQMEKDEKNPSIRRYSREFKEADVKETVGLHDGNNAILNQSIGDMAATKTIVEEQPSYYGDSKVFVSNQDGGKIESDTPGLAAWSVDAMRLVRKQLYRSANGAFELPFIENWTEDQSGGANDNGQVIVEGPHKILPKWALHRQHTASAKEAGSPFSPVKSLAEPSSAVEIVDVPLLVSEVTSLLASMEEIMEFQRRRRLHKLKAQSRVRRNWYMVATGAPILVYIAIKIFKNNYGKDVAKFVVDKCVEFYNEHVSGPLSAIFTELFTKTKRESISDREARLDAIASLKKMIRSWLDETFPQMQEPERQARADRMDMSLIEMKKEENMKTIYEINSVVRMSLIEMQFIKKEMLNAMSAMDEMLKSNEINMNLAAVTPAVLIMYGLRASSRFLFYVLLRVGKSRDETYASFRHVMLDVERLLVMRDNPPSAPHPLGDNHHHHYNDNKSRSNVLSSDDLGMLMLHIHECRTILWQDRHRFSSQTLRDVGEDLAELAGERGIVSVRQQLQILARMYRTYSFMKVVSTGIPFDLLVNQKDS